MDKVSIGETDDDLSRPLITWYSTVDKAIHHFSPLCLLISFLDEATIPSGSIKHGTTKRDTDINSGGQADPLDSLQGRSCSSGRLLLVHGVGA